MQYDLHCQDFKLTVKLLKGVNGMQIVLRITKG